VMQRGALLAIASVDGIEGRAARFEAVFTAHSGVIYAICTQAGTKEEAEDVVSEAFPCRAGGAWMTCQRSRCRG
jgi:hypothetical protein